MPVAAVLGSAELQNLRGVLTDDALRAVQVLPGVATGDDFRSEFSVRGSDFSHLNFTVDGFATPFVLHMVRAVEERANTGSVAMINSDVLEDVTLSNGGYPQRSGNRTGAELGFLVREGSRERNVRPGLGQRHQRVADGRRAARPREARLVAGLGAQELSGSDRQEAARGGSELRLRRRAGQAALRPRPPGSRRR